MATDLLSEVISVQHNSIVSTVLTAGFSGLESSGARFFGKHLTVLSSCNHCGICVRDCPTKNITEQDRRIFFDSNCVLCLRCVYRCPVKAITPRYLKFFIIHPWFNVEKIGTDPSIQDTYITPRTKGFFRHFNKYLTKE
jgi:ferredoxin